MAKIKVKLPAVEELLPAAIEPCDLTPDQQDKWNSTRTMMVWSAPGFRHLWYKLLCQNKGEHYAVMSRSVPVAATDAKNIIINPDKFFEYSLPERVFIGAHEVGHNMFSDVELMHRCRLSGKVPMNDGSTLPYDAGWMNKAMDYRLNAILVKSKIGKCPKDACYDESISDGTDSVLDVYKKIYDPENPGGGQGGFDIVLQPGVSTGQDPNQAAGERNGNQWQVEISAAMALEQMRRQGDIAGALQRMFGDLLNPKVPWQEHIRAIMARRVGSGSYDWRRPDRRFIVRDICMPARSGHGAGWLVVWGDTSGSIGDSELTKYMAEFAGIIEDVRPKRITVLWCDARIHYVDEVEDVHDLYTIKARGVGGKGGTSCRPVFDWIADQLEVPDMFLGFTDGAVTFPKDEPRYPVVWATVDDKATYPWGEVVSIS